VKSFHPCLLIKYYTRINDICIFSITQSSITRRVLDHYVLVSGGGVRVSDVTRGGGIYLIINLNNQFNKKLY